MTTITTHKCDIDGCGKPATKLKQTVQVVFTTEQTEGRPTSPHLSSETMDLCDSCAQRLIERWPIRGAGAQGHNTYVIS